MKISINGISIPMEKNMNLCKCGSKEFITAPNSYDVYKIIKDRLEYQKSQFIDDELVFYCRKCGKPTKELSKKLL